MSTASPNSFSRDPKGSADFNQPTTPTLDVLPAHLLSRQSSPLSTPPKPPSMPQANLGGGGGGVRSGASTPNAGGGGGPGIVNANTFVGYSRGDAGNARSALHPDITPNVGRASQPAPFDMPYAMTPPPPTLLPYCPMTASSPQGHGHGPNRGSDPMYVLDRNTVETIPANVTLNTFSTWSENLLAQVSGVTVNNYSWNLSQAPDLSNVSGTTTANLTGTWTNFSGTTRTDTIRVTETPKVGQAITVTMTFAVAGTDSPAFSSSRPRRAALGRRSSRRTRSAAAKRRNPPAPTPASVWTTARCKPRSRCRFITTITLR